MKIKPFTVIRIVISLFFIGLLIWTMRDKVDQVVQIIKNIDVFLLTIGGTFFIFALIIIAFRLRLLFNAQKLLLNHGEAISLTFIGYFFNNFFPTSFGGDFVKAYYASKKTNDKLSCFATVFMDRLFGMSSLFLLAGIVALFSNIHIMDNSITWPIFAVLGGLFLVFVILWNKNLAKKILAPASKIIIWLKLEEKVKRTYNAIHNFKDKKRLVVGVFFISIVAQFLSFSSIYFWAKGLGNPVSIRIVLLTMPLVSILSVLPSINGLGIRESAIVFLLGPHIGYQNAFALSILWLFMLMIISIIGGLDYAFNNQYKLHLKEKQID